jgi:5'-3' exonuclease
VRSKERLSQSLNLHREQAKLYKTLATLRLDVPLAEGLDDLEWRGARRGELTLLCEELGFTKLLDAIPRFADG